MPPRVLEDVVKGGSYQVLVSPHTFPRTATPGSPRPLRQHDGVPRLRSSEPSNGQVASKRGNETTDPLAKQLTILHWIGFFQVVQKCFALLPMLKENVRTLVELAHQRGELLGIVRADSSCAMAGRPFA